MNFRKLGRTGLIVSEIGFGCGPTAGLMLRGTAEERRAAIARAIELGINYFDTAPIYGDSLSEMHLGQALRELGAKPIVATKIALAINELDDIPGAVIRSVEASRERLGLDRLPLVQLHNRVGARRAAQADIGVGALLSVDDVLGKWGVVETLRQLRDKGCVEFFGCCAFGGETEVVRRIIDSGAFDTILVHYSLLNDSAWNAAGADSALRDYGCVGARATSGGMGAIALRALEGGALFAEEERHSFAGTPAKAPSRAILEWREQLRKLCASEGLPIAEAALRFALANTEISTVLVGFSDIAQIEQAVRSSLPGPLPAPLASRIAALSPRGVARGLSGGEGARS